MSVIDIDASDWMRTQEKRAMHAARRAPARSGAAAGGPGPTTGYVMLYAATGNTPAGWLACNGTAVSRFTYAALFAAIGTEFGAGDGITTFELPNEPPLSSGIRFIIKV